MVSAACSMCSMSDTCPVTDVFQGEKGEVSSAGNGFPNGFIEGPPGPPGPAGPQGRKVSSGLLYINCGLY